ncbi:MAG TPA: WYL domain-containing protein [Gammaproteobacteria bacterium]|nr:WYL domain-containing protein [Gammaproteobacteria bacterium]
MNPTERFYIIDSLLQNNRYVSRNKFLEALDHCHPSKFKRDLRYMRDFLFAPIEYDRDVRAYFLNKAHPEIRRYHLPGLWFNPQEIVAILTLQQYFEDISPDLIGGHLAPLRERLRELVQKVGAGERGLAAKVRIIHLARRTHLPQFQKVAYALMEGKRLKIRHYSRPKDTYTDRQISPLRLVHYRENWYLDAWCHTNKALRTFAVDTIEEAELVNKPAKKLSKKQHDQLVTAGYGIFSGSDVQWATLRFSAHRSRWVKVEQWHPRQVQDFDDEGRYILKIPYSREEELMMDILKYGPDVEVLEPAELRLHIKDRLNEAISLY